MSPPKTPTKRTPRVRRTGRRSFDFLSSQPHSRVDWVTPAFVKLAERYLHSASSDGETPLDQAFRAARQRHSRVGDALLRQLVQDYARVPGELRGHSPLAGVSGVTLHRSTPHLSIFQEVMELRPLGALGTLNPGDILSLQPQVTSLEPPEPVYGYVPGQTITINGSGYSSDPAQDIVEIWALDPDGHRKVHSIEPHAGGSTQIVFSLPQNIRPGTWHLRVAVDGRRFSNFVAFQVAAPTIRIVSIDPVTQEPGNWIVITGEGLHAGTPYDVSFANMDLAEPPAAVHVTALTMPEQPESQLRLQLPALVIAGYNEVQIHAPNDVTPPSNVYAYLVAAPKYRAILTRLHCNDETNWCGTEWGEDEVHAVCAVVADTSVWTKVTGQYSLEEDDKPEVEFSTADAQILTPEGQPAEIRHALAITIGLVETDDDELAMAKDFIGLAGTVSGKIVEYAGGGTAGAKATQAAAAGLKNLIQYIFGGDVIVGQGPVTRFWTGTDLQTMLVGSDQESGEELLDFHGDGDHGWYQLWLRLLRK